MEIKHRHTLRKKDAKKYLQELETTLLCRIPSATVEIGKSTPYDFLFLDGKIHALIIEGHSFLNLKGILAYKPKKKWVTIDMGAVPFIAKGADVMAPGIVAADEGIQINDFVWVQDEKNGQPLAIGRALMSGHDMVQLQQGKAIALIHYVNDEIWKIGESL